VTGAVVRVMTLRAHQYVRRACKVNMKCPGRACQEGARLQRGARQGPSSLRVRTGLQVLETGPGERHTHTLLQGAMPWTDSIEMCSIKDRQRRHGKASTH
jgi:hypothetical protein